MKTTKLNEALNLVYEMTADINGEYPVGLIRVRRLLEEVLADDVPHDDDDDYCYLGMEPPSPAA